MFPPELDALLAFQPLRLAVALLLSAFAGWLARSQARRLGMDSLPLPGLKAWRWSTLVGALVFWMAGAVFVQTSGYHVDGMQELLGLLGRLALAAACLFLGTWLAEARMASVEEADLPTRKRAEQARWPILATGAGGALLSLAGGSTLVVVLAGVAALVLLLLVDSGPSRALAGLLRDLAAGVELRARLKPGTRLQLDGVEHTLSGGPGLLTTRLQVGAETSRARDNTSLLQALGPVDPEKAGTA